VGPKITAIGWSPGQVRQQIRLGSGRMRPIAATRLSDEDMEAVLVYLHSLGTVR
jgi:hypothetical protein